VTIIPEQRDSNDNAARNFSADLWSAFAEIDRGGIRWTASCPLPESWFTDDAASDLERARDLEIEAAGTVMEATARGDQAAKDQARARTRALSQLCDFLEAVVETLAEVQA
jgi:hypothetical protein